MRLFVFNWLLLASVAAALPTKSQKRDLPYLKDLIFGRSQINIQPSPVLQKENGYKLFRLLGHDDVMIKVAPKNTNSSTTIVEKFVYPPAVENVNFNAFGTVVGTKSTDDTLVAVKEVDNLLSTRNLYGGHNNVMKETVVPMSPSLNTDVLYAVEENIKTAPVLEARPVVVEVIDNTPVFTEVIENRPVISEVIIPLEEKVVQNNKPVMTYIAQNNPGVELVETVKTKTELPTCIEKRVEETIVLGAHPNRFAPVQEVFQYQSPQIFDFSYPRVQANSFRGKVLTEGFGTVAEFGFPPKTLRPLKYSPVRYNLKQTKTQAINPRPIALNLHKSHNFEEDISASKDKVNSQTKKVQAFNNLGEKINISQTLGSIPSQYDTHEVKKGGQSVVSNGNVKQMKAVPIESSKDNILNAKIPDSVYKLQSNPNTGKVIQENRGLRTNTYRYNVVTPAVNSQATKKEVKENIKTAIIHEPADVKDIKNYSYQKTNADGSSLNINATIHGVSVSVEENKNSGRGDIPDQ